MTSSPELAEVALAFCNECLGWEDAQLSARGECDWIVSSNRWFPFTDLNAVMKAVQNYADTITVETQDVVPRWYAKVWLDQENAGRGWIRGQSRHDNLCHALLSACVEARRRLKGAA